MHTANKILVRLKTQKPRIKFCQVTSDITDLRFCGFHDAGHKTRPNGKSQAGGLVFLVPSAVLNGERGGCILLDWLSTKIEKVVGSPFEAELQSAQIVADDIEVLTAMWCQIFHGTTSREFRKRDWQLPAAALVGDNKGLYTNATNLSVVKRQGERRTQIDKVIFRQTIDYLNMYYMWVNANHQLADGLTKLSAKASIHLILSVLEHCKIQITYCQKSGKKENAERSKDAVLKKFQISETYDLEKDDTEYEQAFAQVAARFSLK